MEQGNKRNKEGGGEGEDGDEPNRMQLTNLGIELLACVYAHLPARSQLAFLDTQSHTALDAADVAPTLAKPTKRFLIKEGEAGVVPLHDISRAMKTKLRAGLVEASVSIRGGHAAFMTYVKQATLDARHAIIEGPSGMNITELLNPQAVTLTLNTAYFDAGVHFQRLACLHLIFVDAAMVRHTLPSIPSLQELWVEGGTWRQIGTQERLRELHVMGCGSLEGLPAAPVLDFIDLVNMSSALVYGVRGTLRGHYPRLTHASLDCSTMYDGERDMVGTPADNRGMAPFRGIPHVRIVAERLDLRGLEGAEEVVASSEDRCTSIESINDAKFIHITPSQRLRAPVEMVGALVCDDTSRLERAAAVVNNTNLAWETDDIVRLARSERRPKVVVFVDQVQELNRGQMLLYEQALIRLQGALNVDVVQGALDMDVMFERLKERGFYATTSKLDFYI